MIRQVKSQLYATEATLDAFPTLAARDQYLVSELEHSIFADLRKLSDLKGQEYVKELCAKVPLPF